MMGWLRHVTNQESLFAAAVTFFDAFDEALLLLPLKFALIEAFAKASPLVSPVPASAKSEYFAVM